MQRELTCLSLEAKQQSVETIVDLIQDVPALVQDKDFKEGVFEFSGFTETKFPINYEGTEDNRYLMKAIEIVLSSQFDIETSIKFDQPFALMELGLFDNVKFDERI